MKRMHLIIAAVVVALALAGLLAVRHAVRTAETVPPVSDLPAPPKKKASSQQISEMPIFSSFH